MDTDVIQDYHLEEIFHNLSIGLVNTQIEDGINSWKKLFEETRHGLIWVTDDASLGCCVFITDTYGINKNKLLRIEQTTGCPLVLWKIHGAMFQKLSKGDCALIHNKLLHLVEFKANVTSSSELNIVGHYEKAASQIINAYDIIKTLYEKAHINISDVYDDVDAMIVFNPTIPRSNSTQQSFKERFRIENKMLLYMGNVRLLK